jgi:hypothetical protein
MAKPSEVVLPSLPSLLTDFSDRYNHVAYWWRAEGNRSVDTSSGECGIVFGKLARVTRGHGARPSHPCGYCRL